MNIIEKYKTKYFHENCNPPTESAASTFFWSEDIVFFRMFKSILLLFILRFKRIEEFLCCTNVKLGSWSQTFLSKKRVPGVRWNQIDWRIWSNRAHETRLELFVDSLGSFYVLATTNFLLVYVICHPKTHWLKD